MAQDKEDGSYVALKRVLMDNEREGFPITAIREIKLLKSLRHPNVVMLKEIVASKATDYNRSKGSIYMVFEYLEHDLAGIVSSGFKLTKATIKLYMKQLLDGLHYCHVNNILHRDIKGSNLLISDDGRLKIADFGLARSWNDETVPLTKTVITMWYRPPELLLGSENYGKKADIWSVGCILAELLIGQPIFPGKNEKDQLEKIIRICGSPNDQNWKTHRRLPLVGVMGSWLKQVGVHKRTLRDHIKRNAVNGVTTEELDLCDALLALDPALRPDASKALDFNYFFVNPKPATGEQLPKFACHLHEWQVKKRRKEEHQRRHSAGGATGAQQPQAQQPQPQQPQQPQLQPPQLPPQPPQH
mmetsp:Transcript_16941/g.36707  ORF Transcript_16941/g.36707 Transcript_16941/m.36707 type:complete len:358 (+) Transcript_16941:18-1091(+)